MAPSLRRRRFTVEEYHEMVRAGILSEDDRLELIDGEIVEMTPIGRRHALCVYRITDLSHGFHDAGPSGRRGRLLPRPGDGYLIAVGGSTNGP